MRIKLTSMPGHFDAYSSSGEDDMRGRLFLIPDTLHGIISNCDSDVGSSSGVESLRAQQNTAAILCGYDSGEPITQLDSTTKKLFELCVQRILHKLATNDYREVCYPGSEDLLSMTVFNLPPDILRHVFKLLQALENNVPVPKYSMDEIEMAEHDISEQRKRAGRAQAQHTQSRRRVDSEDCDQECTTDADYTTVENYKFCLPSIRAPLVTRFFDRKSFDQSGEMYESVPDTEPERWYAWRSFKLALHLPRAIHGSGPIARSYLIWDKVYDEWIQTDSNAVMMERFLRECQRECQEDRCEDFSEDYEDIDCDDQD